MKIKTVLLLSSLTLVFSIGVIATITLLATMQTDRIAAQGNRATTFIGEVFSLNTLTQAYLERREDRPKEQWYAQYTRLEQTIEDPVFDMRPGRDFVPALRTDLDEIKSAFDDLVLLSQRATGDEAMVELLSGDLIIKTQRLIGRANELSNQAFARRAAARTRTDLTVFALLDVLAIASLLVTYLLYRRIVRPILELKKGAEIIGRGELGRKIGSTADDEIGQLARTFDEMSVQLRQTHDTMEQRITERTAQFKEEKTRNELLLRSIGDGVIAIDLAWNIIQWNRAASAITGYSEQAALGRPFRDIIKFIREHDRSENVLFISDAMLSNKVRFMENHTLLIRKDGTEIPVGDSAAPIVGENGKVQGAIITFRDMSQERSSQNIRSSYAYAHHQLRTPVTVAAWSIQTALDEKDPAVSQKLLDDANRAIKSVQKLSESLIEVSEIDNAMVAPEIKKASVSDLLSAAKKLVSEKATERGIKLSIAAVPKAAAVLTDKKMFVRTLYEVLDNAVEYSASGSEVVVRVVITETETRFEISDQGLGIPEAQQGIIFTKFFRGENIPENSVGAGLGLYAAKEYIKLLKGKIWFQSTEKKGTVFFISLPQKKTGDT